MNGHPLCMAAGCASLDLLDQPAIDRINRLGDSLAVRLDAAARDAGADVRVHTYGSLLQVNTADPLAFHTRLSGRGSLHRAARQHEPVDADGRGRVSTRSSTRGRRALARVDGDA